VAVLLIVATLALPSPALAQEPAGPQAEPLDASKMGISLDRIRRDLRTATSTEEQREGAPLKLNIHVEVFGQAPMIDFFTGFPLTTGPVPRSAPTHGQFLEMVTPQAFKSPPMNFSALAFWAAQRLYEMGKKARCEREVAEYRQLVMQGVNVAAPRCTQ
jgi:hypothetical protein